MKIAQHHAREEWHPLLAWPEDCYVQWGAGGIVLREEADGGPYGTAFFEAFPGGDAGGFIRGEGGTVEAAEAAAYAEWRKADACDHRFGRRGYTNAGGTCIRCGHFASVFKPVVQLGHWKRPIEIEEISFAVNGNLCSFPHGPEGGLNVFKRRTLLRLRAAGMAIPDPVVRTRIVGDADFDEWVRRTKTEVRRWLSEADGLKLLEEKPGRDGAFLGFFRSMDRKTVERLLGEPDECGSR